MAKDYLYIGSTPYDEPCEQVGAGFRRAVAKAECLAYARQLVRLHGESPTPSAYLGVKWEQHDFGSYPEVVAYFDSSDPEGQRWAYAIEESTPALWDDEAKKELSTIYGREGANAD